jgi:2-phosphosulfolactate phosphatase
MHIEVAFTPALLTDSHRKVAVVIDVLRATTSLATMFNRGLAEAIVVEEIAGARKLAAEHPGWLLCGEEHSLPPEGFDYGNSPSEFDQLDLKGKRAVLVTGNGTKALARAAGCPVVLAGALVNLRAVVTAAYREAAERELDIVLVCAGRNHARYFSLEDTFCAGAMVDLLMRQEAERPRLWNDAAAAWRLYKSYRGSASAAFREADHGKSLVDLGLGRDLAFCAQRDTFDVVPRMQVDSGLLRVRAVSNAGSPTSES